MQTKVVERNRLPVFHLDPAILTQVKKAEYELMERVKRAMHYPIVDDRIYRLEYGRAMGNSILCEVINQLDLVPGFLLNMSSEYKKKNNYLASIRQNGACNNFRIIFTENDVTKIGDVKLKYLVQDISSHFGIIIGLFEKNFKFVDRMRVGFIKGERIDPVEELNKIKKDKRYCIMKIEDAIYWISAFGYDKKKIATFLGIPVSSFTMILNDHKISYDDHEGFKDTVTGKKIYYK